MLSDDKNKAKKINEMLESGNLSPELDEAVKEIKKEIPKKASSKFQESLKAKMLKEHQAILADQNISKDTTMTSQKSFFSFFQNFSFSPMKLAVTAAILIVVLVGSYPFIPTPTVEGYTQAGRTVEISYNAPIKINFSQLMSRGSVEDSFSITPEVEGKFAWSGGTLMFYPEDEFNEGEVYSVVIGKDAKSVFQKSLGFDYEENFKIVGPPKASLITPTDESKEVPIDSKLTFMFDRPMLALEPLEDVSLNDVGIEIKPKLDGRIKFLGTSAFQFIPEDLQYSTTYSIHVDDGLEAIDGGVTEEAYDIEFETVKPKILGYTPSNSSGTHAPDTEIQIRFNQPIDLSKFKSSTSLYAVDDLLRGASFADLKSSELYYEDFTKVDFEVDYFDFEKDEYEEEDKELLHGLKEDISKNYLTIKPKGNLPLDSTFVLLMDEDLQAAEGDLTLGEEERYFFKTAGPLEVKNTVPANNDTSAKDSFASIQFNNPIKEYEEGELEKLIKFNPPKAEGQWTFSHSTYSPNHIYVYGGLEPSTDYFVTVSGNIEDQFGQKLGDDFTYAFRTADRKPSFEIRANYSLNVLDKNKPLDMFVKSTNINNLDVILKPLSDDEFSAMYGQGYLSLYNYSPSEPTVYRSVTLNNKFNKSQFTRVNLEKVFGTLAPGTYYLEAWNNKVLGYKGVPTKQKMVLMVSRTALTYKHSKDEVLVWATSLKDGAPVNGMNIKVQNYKGEVFAEGFTDSRGIFKARMADPDSNNRYSHPDFQIYGSKGDDFAFVQSSWSEGVSPWNFEISSTYLPTPYYSSIYTERPLYRPGDTVHFKGIIREAGHNSLQLPRLRSTHVVVKDSSGQQVFEDDLLISQNGTFNAEVQLAPAAKTGRYSITASLDGNNTGRGGFNVNEYRKPDYKVSLEGSKENFIQGDKVEIDVSGEFFFGAAMSNAEITWSARTQDYYFNKYDGDSWYSFSEEGYFCYWGCSGGSDFLTQGRGLLDENGKFAIELDGDLKEKKVSQFYSVEATVFDENNQSVSNRITIPVHQGEYYVGIANDNYVVKQGDDAKFKLVAVDYDGKVLEGKNIEVSLYEREWNTVKKKNVDGGYYYESEYEDTLISQKSAKTAEGGKAEVSFPTEGGGLYRAVAVSKDSSGNEIVAATNVYVSSSDFVYWGFDNNDQIDIITDKQEYSLGDTAKLLVKSPYQDAYALLTYERENIKKSQVIKLASNSETIEIPITEEFLPNMFVSVVVVKGSDKTAGLPELEDSENEREVAAFKVGYATLHVDTESKKLDIDLSLNKDEGARYLPGEEVTVFVDTKDADGNAKPAEVSVAVVDESVLSLSNKVVADLIKVFYRDRMLSVQSAFTMTKALARINVQIEAGLKGGGGGYTAKRSNFQDTAFWVADLQTGRDGKGQTSFTLPDNLTSWEVLAIGVSKDTLLGSQRVSFKTQKDVLIRPILPRFLSIADEFEAGAIVHNNTDDDLRLSVSVMSDELDIQSSKEQNISVKAHSTEKIVWDAVAPKNVSIENVKVNFLAKSKEGGDLGDQVEISLPLQGSSFPEHVATSGSFTDDITKIENVVIPAGVDTSLGHMTAQLAPTFAGSLKDGLEDVIGYPYGCSEQTASAMLPNLRAKQAMALPIIPNDIVDPEEIDKNVEAGIIQLYKHQRLDGGWGLWVNSDSNPYLTAYVLLTLSEASGAGYSVDQATIKRGVDYLYAYMKNNSNISGSDRTYLNANQRAYVLFVLSELNAGDLGLTNNLYQVRDLLNIAGKANLAMAMENFGVVRKADQLRDEILLERQDTPRGISFSEENRYSSIFDSDTRTTALVLQMMTRVDFENPVNDKIIRYLLNERKGYGWRTTQESSVALGALLEYLVKSGETSPNFEAKLDVNKENLIEAFFTSNNFEPAGGVLPVSELNSDGEVNELAITRAGTGKLYYDVVLEYYLPVEDIKPRNEGIVIYHEYFDLDDEEETQVIREAEAGENIKARMTVVVSEDRYYVAVEDFLPAGLEPIDFSLKTTQTSLKEKLDKGDSIYWWRDNLWRFNHKEFRDDRVVYFADFLPKGVYEIEYFLRATTPGDFVDLPAKAHEMYFPEVFGQTSGHRFQVLGK